MINAYIAKNSYDYTGLVYEEPYMRYYADGKKASRQGVKIDDSCGTVNFVQVEEDGIDYCIIRIGKRGYATGAISLDENYLTYMKDFRKLILREFFRSGRIIVYQLHIKYNRILWFYFRLLQRLNHKICLLYGFRFIYRLGIK